MTTVYVAADVDDETRRARLYAGDIFVLPPSPASLALTDFAREMLEAAFAPLDPLTAQYEMAVERFVEIFGPVKPAFIHHPKTLGLIRDLVTEQGASADDTYLDVPRLRGVTSNAYLTAGVGYAHHPHRDTWYSAPMCQLNWWTPIYPFESESSMAFHTRYWSEPVRNGSAEFDYYEWNNVGRRDAAKHIHADTRKQPGPQEPVDLDPQIRVVCPPGGIVLFSPAHLHSTVPNTSGRARFSIDFRTVNSADLDTSRSAPNVDSFPTGTSLRDFVRASDFSPLPAETVARYDHGHAEPPEGTLVFVPDDEIVTAPPG